MYGPSEILRGLAAIREGHATFQVRAALEHHLGTLLRDEGHAALKATLLALPGLQFVQEPTGDGRTFLYVSEEPDRPPLVVTAYRGEHSSSLNVATERPARRVPDDPKHQRFYRIWESLTGVVDVEELDPASRAVFLIASLEADLMNGGIGQYLANSNGTVIDATLASLDKIGAAGTADLLRGAVSICGAEASYSNAWEKHSEALSRIDDQFLALGEDLAGLAFNEFLARFEE